MTVTRTCRHYFQLLILVSLLLYQRQIITATEQTPTVTDAEVEEHMNLLMDSILEDVITHYDSIKTDNFWHPFDFGTGNDNREVINVVGITEHQIPGKIIQWKNAKIGFNRQIIALKNNSIEIYDSQLHKTFTQDLPFTLSTMEVFTQWDAENLTPFMVIVVATNSPNILIFRSSNPQELRELGSFPLPSKVQSVMISRVDKNEKIVLVPANSSDAINIYNIEISKNEAQLWFSQRLPVQEYDCVIVHQPDTVDSMLLVSNANHLSVYQFDSSMGQYRVHSTLALHNKCNNMLTFTMMYQHYVSCMTKGTTKDVQFLIYNFNMNEYEESSLNKVKASEMFPIAIGGSRGDTMFISQEITEDGGESVMSTLIFDGHNSFRTGKVGCTTASCGKLSTLSRATSFEFQDNNALAFPTVQGENSALVLMFVTAVTPTFSPVFLQSKSLFDEFIGLSSEAKIWRNKVSRAEDVLSRKLNTDGDNNLTGKWTIKSIVTEDAAVEGREGRASASDEIFGNLKFGNVDWTEQDFASTNSKIKSHLKTMDSNLLFISKKMNGALLKRSTNVQVVMVNTTMKGVILAENAEFNTINVKTIGGTDAVEYFHSLAHQHRDLKINGGLIFTNTLQVSHVETTELNKILVNDIAVLSDNNVFQCHSTFETVHSIRNVVVSKVNGNKLADSVVMASNVSGLHLVDGVVAYAGAETTKSIPFDNVMLISKAQTVESPTLFNSVKVQGPMSVNILNGKDLKTFTDNIITRDFKGTIAGEKTFVDSVNFNTLSISSKWNELAFPKDFFLTSVDSIVLDGENDFTSLNASKVSATKEINGINTRDLVSLTGADMLDTSKWIFNGDTTIAKNIVVENEVDGVLMETFPHHGIFESHTENISPNADTIVFKQPVHIEHLNIETTINDEPFTKLFGNMILFEGGECHIPGKTMINGAATFSDIKLNEEKINDFPMKDFLTRDTSQTISNKVTMSGNVFFEELHALKTIDSVEVHHVLEKAIRVSKNTHSDGTIIPWDVNFQSIQCKSSLTINGAINDSPAYKTFVALAKGEQSQIIKGPIEVSNPTFSTLELKNLELSPGKTLQSLDVNEWNTTRAKLSKNTVFSHPFTVNRITVNGNLDTLNINGIHVEDLNQKVFRNNGKSQQFRGRINMVKGFRVNNGTIKFHDTVEKFSIDEFIAHGFPLQARNDKLIVIQNDWLFQSLKMEKEIQTNDNVCGVSLSTLESDSVKRNDKNVEVLEEKIFATPLEITTSLTSPQVNGKQLKNLFRLDDNQMVEGHSTFKSVVFKNVLVADSVNNIDTKWLSDKYSFDNGQHIIVDHNVITKHPMKTDSIRVVGKTQSILFDDFVAETVQHSDHNIEFKDAVKMTHSVEIQNGISTNRYNGLDFDDLSKRTVQLDRETTLQRPISFTDAIKADEVVVQGDLKSSSLTNGINWNELQRKSIKLKNSGKHINLKKAHFKNLVATQPVNVSELNGKSFNDYVTLNTPQTLGKLKFDKVSLESANVNIGGTMGSHDISDEFADTLMSNTKSPQSLPGKVVINGPVHVKQNMSCFGSSLKHNVITTSDSLELEPVEFTSPVTVENNIQLTKPIGGHNISSIFSEAFMTDAVNKSQTISNLWTFEGPVIFMNNVTGKGLKSSINIPALIQQTTVKMQQAAHKVDESRQRFLRKCNTLHKFRNMLAKNPVKLDSFDSHQVILLKNEGANVLAVESDKNNDVMLLVQNANCELDRYQWQKSNELFHKVMEAFPLNIGKIDDWQSVSIIEGGSVVVFSKSISTCSRELGLFYITITPNGKLSSVVTIFDELPIQSFKVVKKQDTGEIWLFNLVRSTTGSRVQVFTWEQKEFIFMRDFMQMDSTMDRLDVTAFSRGFGLMCHNGTAVTMYTISTDGTEDAMVSGAMLTSTSGSTAVFENFGTLYALLPEAGTVSTLIQPTCNFQVMRLNGGSIETVQKLQVPEVVSASLWSFSNKKFITFLSKSHGMTLYKFMGVNGFHQVNKPYKAFGGFILKSFSIKSSGFEEVQPFLLMLSKNTIEIYRSNVFGDTLHSDFGELCSTSNKD